MAKIPKGSVSAKGAIRAEAKGISANQVKGLTDSDVAGIEVIEDRTDEVLAAMPVAIARALEEIGLVAEGKAKKLCPVDTGRLRNSITHTVGNDEAAYIGTNVEYARYQELGTSRIEAANGGRGFLRPAAADNADTYRRIVEKHMKNG